LRRFDAEEHELELWPAGDGEEFDGTEADWFGDTQHN
jgi:hypothetical protein